MTFVQQDIGWFDISMNHALSMSMIDGLTDGGKEMNNVTLEQEICLLAMWYECSQPVSHPPHNP